MPALPSLPIDVVLPELLAALQHSSSVVLQAPTGAGKTTRVPPAILDAGLAESGQILLLEPRRLAARAAARRMAFERGVTLGEEVGYQVRFDQRCTRQTRLLAITDGILLRRLQDDPFLESVSVILFDEFHERSLNLDLTLAMARRVQQTVRPDLKLIVMSATLAAGPVAKYLGDCPIITSEGRLHPVEIRYRPAITSQPVVDQVVSAVDDLLISTPGNLLVFLPGVREIQQAGDRLGTLAEQAKAIVLPLYGDLSPEQQDRVLSPQTQRKIVLATNVAETSVTIDGVTGVIDSGQVRQMQFDPGLGLDRLVLTKISQASSDQRAGRAGRTQPGVCLRLWMEREQRGLAADTEPEIRRVDLAGPVLELLCWGESDITAFPWFEAPRPEAVAQAISLLTSLGAIKDGQPTDIGRQMVQLPVHPRLARLLIEGHRNGVSDRAAWMAALLTERDPFERADYARKSGSLGPAHYSFSDVLDRVQALEEFTARGRTDTTAGRLHPGAARFLQQAQQQLLRLVNSDRPTSANTRPRSTQPKQGWERDEAVLKALLTAFPDRVARRREPLNRKGVMVGGRGIRLADSSLVLQPELFLCVDTDAGQGEIFVRQASGIERDWLPANQVEVTIDVTFDSTQEKIVAQRRTRYFDLILDESATTPPSGSNVSDVLAEAALKNLDRAIPWDDPAVSSVITRVRCLKTWLPDCGLPAFDDSTLENLLPSLCSGCRSFADLHRAPWAAALRASLTYQQQQFLDREAPERIQVPSGSQITVHYEPERSPILAVRIQELFGLKETPRIAAGRIPVVLHLLGPNYRPQQITDDLKSFWNNTYPEVRKELKRRYPKHSWPEDPWSATPENKGGRRA
ncbi:MAG: hrpB 2 [Planctomycetaceae bacterium]|nr:hrpB 2 [Planctomycetaceae bacterium]